MEINTTTLSIYIWLGLVGFLQPCIYIYAVYMHKYPASSSFLCQVTLAISYSNVSNACGSELIYIHIAIATDVPRPAGQHTRHGTACYCTSVYVHNSCLFISLLAVVLAILNRFS